MKFFLITTLFILLICSGLFAQTTTPIALDSSEYKLFYLAPDAPIQEQMVTIGEVTKIEIELISTSSNITPIITSPDGQQITQYNISSYGGSFESSQIPYEYDGLKEVTQFILEFPTLGVGQYKIKLEAPANLTEGIAVGVKIGTDSPIGVTLITTESNVSLGKSIILTAAIFNNQTPLNGATVGVTVTAPNGTISNINLLDDGSEADNLAGDGLYSAKFTPNEIGNFSASAEISGITTNNIAYLREAAAEFSVTPATSKFTGNVSDFAVQNPNDIRFLEKIVIQAETDTTVAGNYGFNVYLKTNNNKYLVANSSIELQAGLGHVEADIQAQQILEVGEDGPFYIEKLELVLQTDEADTVIDTLINKGQTQPYQLSEMTRPEISLTGVNNIIPVDINENGKYEALIFQIGVNVVNSESYQYSLSLFDSNRNEIIWINDQSYLNEGDNIISIRVNSENILRHGTPGPFQIGNLVIEKQDNSILRDNVLITPAYELSQFELGLEFAGNYSATGVDTNSDGKFNLLRVQGNINAAIGGDYNLQIRLMDSENNVIANVGEIKNFAAGTNTFDLDIRGESVYSAGKNGPYHIFAYVSGQGLTVMNDNLFQTSAFSYSDFELAFGFTGNTSAVGIDTNGNGRFETLRVNTEVKIETPSDYLCSASLIDVNGNYIETVYTNAALVPGVNTVSFDFSGVKISDHGVDGPYKIRDVSIQGPDNASKYELFTTEAFTLNQFDAPEPDLQYVNYNILPSAGDLFLEPGESAKLHVNLLNRGLGRARNVEATLTSTSPDVEIADATSNYDPISPLGEHQGSGFTINLKPEAFYGNPVSFVLSTTFNNGQTKTFNFSIQTGKLNKILYTNRFNNMNQVFSRNADGSGNINLSNNTSSDYHPIPSPNGSKIMFLRQLTANTSELWVMNSDGSNKMQLTTLSVDWYSNPSWSSDGTKIAFIDQVDYTFDLYVVNADATGLTRLTNDPDMEESVSWASNLNKIAYSKNGQVHVVDPDGANDTVIHTGEFQSDVKWSSDGSWLSWIDGRIDYSTGIYYQEIYISKFDGTEKRKITENTNARRLSWSPDSTRILYIGVLADSNPQDIFSVNIATSQSVNITNFLDTDLYNIDIEESSKLDWSIDSKKIVFAATESFSISLGYRRTSVFTFDLVKGELLRITDMLYASDPVWERLDRIPPSSKVISTPAPNSAGWHKSDVNLGISATDNLNGSGVQSITYSSSGAQPTSSTSINGNSASLNIFTEGITTLNYFAKDNSNSTEDSKNHIVKIDKSSPTSSNSTSSNEQQTTVTLSATDVLSGVDSIFYSIDGGSLQNYNGSFSVSNVGSHYVTYYAKDLAGNEENPRVIYINAAQTPKSILISEFRSRGQLGSDDEFIELYNNGESPIDISGWTIKIKEDSATTPNTLATINTGAVIPARGHYLLRKAGTGTYSLSAYAEGDQVYTDELPDSIGIALFSDSSVIIDAVGFSSVTDVLYKEGTGLAPSTGITTNGQYSFVRKYTTSGLLLDSNNNQSDFAFVSTDGGTFNGLPAILGSPGPENVHSPIYKEGDVFITRVDEKVTLVEEPNRFYDYTATSPQYPVGTLSILRKLTNNTGGTINSLKLRITGITTKNSAVISSPQAILHLINSSDITVTSNDGLTTFPVKGLSIENVPTSVDGGLNSSVNIDLGTNGLANGESLNIHLKSGLVTNGPYILEFRAETKVIPVLAQF